MTPVIVSFWFLFWSGMGHTPNPGMAYVPPCSQMESWAQNQTLCMLVGGWHCAQALSTRPLQLSKL